MSELPLAAHWPLALALLVSWPLILAILAFIRLLRPGMLLLLGLPVMLLACYVTVAGSAQAVDLPLTLAVGGWATPLGIQWLVDEPAAWMLVTLNSISALASLAALLMGRSLGGSNYYWPLWWLLWGGMNALVISADLFNLYVTLELVTLTAVGLVAQSRNDPEGKAAMDYLLASLLASLFYLLGVALIYGQTGTLDLLLLQGLLEADGLTSLAALLMTLGLLLKAAVVPLHFWLPNAHSRAQAPVSVVLSSVVVAVAVYLLWRLWLGPFLLLLDRVTWAFSLLTALALVWGGVLAFLQPKLKLVLAYSTLSQLGFALMLLVLVPETTQAVWTSLQGQGALVFLLAHGLAKAALFMAAGALILVYGSDSLKRLEGSAGVLPVAWIGFALASISLLGAPPTAGFVGKWQLLQAALQVADYWTAFLLLLGTLLTAIYLFRVMQFAWKKTPKGLPLPRPDWRAQSLAWLTLFTALCSWLLGSLMLGWQPFQVFAALHLDAVGQKLFWPVLLLWPLGLALSIFWQEGRQLQLLLLVGWLLNLLLIFAQDLLTFYIAFALLSFLGWWLVIYSATPQALAAGRLYLGMSLFGELAFFTALGFLAGFDLSIAALAQEDLPSIALVLLAVALAIKAGMLGVHIWLPLAHPVAPAPASALLSGLMIKAGVLGWIRLFPEQSAVVSWSEGLLLLGLIAAFYAVVRGLMQRQEKSLLAWSSISQMGLMTALLGVLLGLDDPQQEAWVLASLLLLVATHAFAKAVLFLGVGLAQRAQVSQQQGVRAGLLLAALTLVGVPLTGGYRVKSSLEISFDLVGVPAGILFASSLATAILLGRLLVLLANQPVDTSKPGLSISEQGVWWLGVLATVGYGWLGSLSLLEISWFSLEGWVKAWLPVLLAGLVLVCWKLWLPATLPSFRLPWRCPQVNWSGWTGRLQRLEDLMQSWAGVGFLLAVVTLLLAGLLAYSLVI
ncbi:Formate hydrogenlyase subunit 3/Multisubunit Na+/H+ antiporter, MnhD subunit [Marinospirillum celere]|uniref:Formate hydrogenlyase subunit 3/Multisubunit Na+/H+ antiporter, MnhD subunit n=1 Tax=Marinospirillum celere TaxID=1122252 RepID=A0A1I1EGY6_9GAMM|nr:proton-conducting transporter membrane subunit [Marinospirillum celere]SFB86361.1 Formate hydrogenlyase subunit 3/Multisubunit Na+/H+ antiporter, MnhD subunit [Marinospirillum celere]